jgi:hypothetical protein
MRLRAATQRLPPDGSASPPIDRLVIIGFQTGGTWAVRTYDRAKLPAAMREIYDIVGERDETRARRASTR